MNPDARSMLLVAKSDEEIGDSLDNLHKIMNLEFEIADMAYVEAKDHQTKVVLMIPSEHQSGTKIFLFDEFINDCKDSYSIPPHQTVLLYCPNTEEGKEFESHNNITTYISDSYKHNIHSIISEEDWGTDYLIYNYMNFPLFIEKSDEEQIITTKNYPPKFTFFGAENPYIFNAFYSYVKKNAKIGGININNYLNLTQMNLRINSNYLPWFEFYNFYFNQLDLKINFYINQIYGGSDIYECSAYNFDERDLSTLAYPISNMKCSNKKSIFNRLFTLDETKILSGYITPDSYFDIYAEIDNGNTIIDISPIMKDTLMMSNTAKYIKRDIEYTINFNADHMVKLEPGSKAIITIYKEGTTTTINSQIPYASISGKGNKIKSTEDVMVYFIGRFSDNQIVQKEIDIYSSKGKIIKVSNVYDDIILDIGFENYYPSTPPISISRRENGIIYFDNIYEKLNGQLNNGEKVYLYYFAGTNPKIQIDYIDNSLSHKNNDFNIYYIPGNYEEKTLIINTNELTNITTDIYFCQNSYPNDLKLTFLGEGEEGMNINTYNDYIRNNFALFRGDNKMTFSSNNPFIFSYSFYDTVDEDYFDKDGKDGTLWREREELSDFRINSISSYSYDSFIEIGFYPSYRNSLTRYIIIIAKGNYENDFYNPCELINILNQRPDGIKIETIVWGIYFLRV
mgnify:CR=1 FL=1